MPSGSTRRGIACCLVLALAPVARAQTSELTPFTLSGQVAVTTPRGPRTVEALQLVATSRTGPWELSGTAAFVADDPATPAPQDGRYSMALARDVGGTLLRYVLRGSQSEFPRMVFDAGTRFLAFAEPGLAAPRTGDVRKDIVRPLCNLYVNVQTIGKGAVTGVRLDVTNRGVFEGGAILNSAAPTADPTGTGFVRTDNASGPSFVLVETIVPGSGIATVSGSVTFSRSPAEDIEGIAVDLGAQDCSNIRVDARTVVLPPKPAQPVRGTLTVRPDPAHPTTEQPLATGWRVALSRPLPLGGELVFETLATPDAPGETARYELKVPPENWKFAATADLLYPFGASGSLTVPRSLGSAYSPYLRPPLPAGPLQGVYADGHVLMTLEEEERASVSAELTLVGGRVQPTGCVGPEHVRGGSVVAAGLADGAGTVFRDERGGNRTTLTGAAGGRAVAPISHAGATYLLPTTEGVWQESSLRVFFAAPGRTPEEQPGTELDLRWVTPRPLLRVTAGEAPPESLHSLPASAVNVTLRVRDPVTGAPRPFHTAIVNARGDWFDANGTMVASWEARAYGTSIPALEQRVVLVVPPGVHDVEATALVPENLDGSGVTSMTSFPPITAVPARPPRADGSCAAVCTDPGTNVFWDDDLSPPDLLLDAAPPATTRETTLVLSGSARDESPITRVLVNGVAATLGGTDEDPARTFTGTVPLAPGANTVVLEVGDRCGGRAVRRFDVVRRVNKPPLLVLDERVTVREGDRLEVRALAFDEDADQQLTYTLRHGPLPGSARPRIDPIFGVVTWTPGFDQSGLHPLEVTVTDGEARVTGTLEVEVLHVNRPPVVDRIGGLPVEPGPVLSARENEPFTALVEAHDPDGDALTYALAGAAPEGLVLDPATGLVTWLPGFDGPREVLLEVTVVDADGLSATAAALVEVEDVNRAPELQLPDVVQGRENEPLEVTVRAVDLDLDPIVPVVTPPHAGMAVEQQPGDMTMRVVLRWTPGFDDAGTWLVPVSVDDGRGGRVEGTVTLEIANANRAPVVTPFEPPAVDGFAGELTLVVTDPDGDPVTCVATELPEHTRYEDRWRRLSWSGDLLPTGLRTVHLRCTDGTDTTDYDGALRGAPGVLTGGCDCATANSTAWTALLVGLLAVRRRRGRGSPRLARAGGPV